MDRPEEVAHVEDADDVVERVSIDRVARERRVDDRARERSSGGMSTEIADHLGARHHHRGDLLRGEVEDLVEHLLLGLLELADVLGRGDRVADVLARVGDHPGRRGLHAQEPEDDVRGLLEQPDERVRDPREPVERDGERDRERLGLLQRDRLRHELADDDGEVREDRERDQERDRVGERRLHEVREERLSDRTEQDREDRDPHLDGRDEADRVVHEAERCLRAAAASLGALLETRAPRRDERVLGRHEDRVPQHEEEHDERVLRERSVHHAPSGAPVLGG